MRFQIHYRYALLQVDFLFFFISYWWNYLVINYAESKNVTELSSCSSHSFSSKVSPKTVRSRFSADELQLVLGEADDICVVRPH